MPRPTTHARITNTYVLQTVETAPFYPRSANNQSIVDTSHHILIGYRTYNITFFLHRLRISVSYSEAGANAPMFSLFPIPLRRRRPHEYSSRPRCRPSSGAAEAGGHCGGTSKRKYVPRVEKRPAKRGEHSDFHCYNKILDLLHMFIIARATKSFQ